MGNSNIGGYIKSSSGTQTGGLAMDGDTAVIFNKDPSASVPFNTSVEVKPDGLYISHAADGYQWARIPENSDITVAINAAKEYTDLQIETIPAGGTFIYKGDVATFTDLPTGFTQENNFWLYHVEDTGYGYRQTFSQTKFTATF
jgi:hypothetical protein